MESYLNPSIKKQYVKMLYFEPLDTLFSEVSVDD